MKKPRQKTIKINRLSNLRMAAGEEQRISRVIHDGNLKEWVAIGWITVRRAAPCDKKRYPTAVE